MRERDRVIEIEREKEIEIDAKMPVLEAREIMQVD